MRFIESTHKYIDDGSDYTPVTYFIKSFQEYVDWKAIAEKKAKKEGTTAEALLAEWDKIKNEAAAKGTAFHKLMEDQSIKTGKASFMDKELPVKYYETFAGIKEDASMELEDSCSYSEKIIWSKKYKICGTADIVNVVDGRIYVLDYKTNKKLDKESWRNPRTGKTKKLLSPVSDLDDCNFNIYQLQLNTYMYMLLQANRKLKLGGMIILHIKYDEEGNYAGIDTHECRNLQGHVKKMLEKFKTK